MKTNKKALVGKILAALAAVWLVFPTAEAEEIDLIGENAHIDATGQYAKEHDIPYVFTTA